MGLDRLGQFIWEALPGTSTAASRMWHAARHQRPWRSVPPAQRAGVFLHHQQVLHQLQSKHHDAKIMPIIVDFLYERVCTREWWEVVVVFGLLVLCASRGS